jgi:hypothetical protein
MSELDIDRQEAARYRYTQDATSESARIWGRAHFCVAPDGYTWYAHATEDEARAMVDRMNSD